MQRGTLLLAIGFLALVTWTGGICYYYYFSETPAQPPKVIAVNVHAMPSTRTIGLAQLPALIAAVLLMLGACACLIGLVCMALQACCLCYEMHLDLVTGGKWRRHLASINEVPV